jgi:hypothetical protein
VWRGARGVLQSLQVRCSKHWRCRRRVVLLQGWRLVQSFSPAAVSPTLVKRSRFAVGRYLDFAVFPWRASVIDIHTDQPSPLFEFASLLEFCPANPSQPAAASRLLSWTLLPFSTSGFGSPPDAGVPRPATFRLQGLATLLAGFSFRARVGLVSCRRRSWVSPSGAFPSRKVPATLPPG